MPNLKPFRAFRALRALRAIKFLTYCAAILDALASAMPMFGDVITLTCLLLVIFGIMGVQIFKCKMKRQCMSLDDPESPMEPEMWCNGDLYSLKTVGAAYTCPRGFACLEGDNPNDGWVGFDNLALAVFTIFQCSTLEGWTSVMYVLQDSESEASWLYMVFAIHSDQFSHLSTNSLIYHMLQNPMCKSTPTLKVRGMHTDTDMQMNDARSTPCFYTELFGR